MGVEDSEDWRPRSDSIRRSKQRLSTRYWGADFCVKLIRLVVENRAWNGYTEISAKRPLRLIRRDRLIKSTHGPGCRSRIRGRRTVKWKTDLTDLLPESKNTPGPAFRRSPADERPTYA